LLFLTIKLIALGVMALQNEFVVSSRERSVMSNKPKIKQPAASPDDYRQFAAESVRRCLAMPNHLRRGRMVQLMLAKAWHKLADQAEELRKQNPPSVAGA
jgi:hypothetical protein